MAFETYTWKDHDSEYPKRRILMPENGWQEGGNDPISVTIDRDEGLVYEEGDTFGSKAMNDLEERIASAITDVEDLADTKIPLNGTTRLSGPIVPASNNTLTLGTASNKFNNVHSTNFTGALIGNASTATTATSSSRSTGQTFVINNATIQGPGGQSMLFYPQSGATAYGIRMGVIDGAWRLHPVGGGGFDLGHPSAAATWANGYFQTAPSIVSDKNEKNTINELNQEKSEDFILGLRPSSFKLNDGTSGRTHYGLISQDVEQLLSDLGMSTTDFAGFVKHKSDETGEVSYGLRYEEFIAPIISVIQRLCKRVEELEKSIKE